MPDAVIIDALRTPIGRYAGVLAPVCPDDLAARVIAAAVERNGLDLRRAGRAPVHLLRPGARIPAADRQEDPDRNQPAEEDEGRELVHAGRVYAPSP